MNVDTTRTGLSESVLNRLREVFSTAPALDEVLLYGSRAKGTARPASDIDLVLKGRGLTHRDLLALANTLDDLLLPQKIDLALYAHLDNPALREHVDRVGIVLYTRQ